MSMTEARFIEVGDTILNLDGVKVIVVDIELIDSDDVIGYGVRFTLNDGQVVDVEDEYSDVEVW